MDSSYFTYGTLDNIEMFIKVFKKCKYRQRDIFDCVQNCEYVTKLKYTKVSIWNLLGRLLLHPISILYDQCLIDVYNPPPIAKPLPTCWIRNTSKKTNILNKNSWMYFDRFWMPWNVLLLLHYCSIGLLWVHKRCEICLPVLTFSLCVLV